MTTTREDKKLFIMEMPAKAATFNKWIEIYRDSLRDFSVIELSERYVLSRRQIIKILSWGAEYCSTGFSGKEVLQIAKDKTEMAIRGLEDDIQKIETSKYLKVKDKWKIQLQYKREIRANRELIFRLDGLLKIDINQFIDKRSVTIVHNVGELKAGEERKKELEIE